jgi:hypothetical protein
MRTKILILAILMLSAIAVGGAEWIEDPSLQPIVEDRIHSGERVRLLADFNADGIQDMALSVDRSLFGNAGGTFALYLGDGNGKYRKHGEFFAHPMAVSLEKINNKVRLWTYYRGGGWIGQIGYNEVLKDRLSEYQSIAIHPGDSGTRMGNAIYESVIYNSDLSITVEWSETTNGIVRWIERNKVSVIDKP